ncbi:MAG: hypothetical protein E3K37_09920 [Candidatus Kuenenia sp.]|nr:hypothetical protein [Candidatus Kuenenia hertensis]
MNRKKNTFLTGAPSSGKTTVIQKIIDKLDFPANGFYTEEERIEGENVAFPVTYAGKLLHLYSSGFRMSPALNGFKCAYRLNSKRYVSFSTNIALYLLRNRCPGRLCLWLKYKA